jgi:hypothetical protein
MIRCFENSPAAIFTYLILWKQAKKGNVTIKKDSVMDHYWMHPIHFEDHLSLLGEYGIISFSYTRDGYKIFVNEEESKNALTC